MPLRPPPFDAAVSAFPPRPPHPEPQQPLETALGKRLEWRATQDSAEVCAIKTTKRGEVIAKFKESGKCSIIWLDPKTDDEGEYTFIAKE